MTAPGPGHNKGPTMEKGRAWRRHCWTKARRDLLPTMPLEIVRIRMRRARELGLAYATYNTIRATSGHDVVAFLFSSNALRMHRLTDSAPAERLEKLNAIANCGKVFAAQPPFSAESLCARLDAQGVTVTAAIDAPGLAASWSDLRQTLSQVTRAMKLPSEGVVIIGETCLEREWCAAGRMAGFVRADDYFHQGATS